MQLKKEIKFETLKKSHKKQIIIGSVLVCVVGSILTFNLTKAKYRLTQSMKLVTGTINYKVPDMRVVAVNISEDGTNYEITDDIPESGYTLNEEKSVCKVQTETSGIENALKDENITIKYENNKISFYGITKRNTRCYLYFDKYVEPTCETTLARLGITGVVNQTSSVPAFRTTATKAENVDTNNGIFRTDDGMYGGKSVYWRGAATTNHVIFANKCWRIIRINGDGSIRLIYNGAIQSGNTCLGNGTNASTTAVTSQTYNASANNSAYVGYTHTAGAQRPTLTTGGTASNLKIQTETWYNDNIGNNVEYASHVADGKYCNDRNIKPVQNWVSTGTAFQYAAYERLYDKKTPALGCDEEDVYILKAGALTADEVSMAGGVYGTTNQSYYLYNGQNYWTMSPFNWNGSSAIVFRVNNNGNLHSASVNNSYGVRPVINLRSDVTFNSESNGTQNNPYVVQ